MRISDWSSDVCSSDLRQRMVALRNSVSNAGPYAFVRLSHHGAANGTDNAFLDAVHETSRFGISTGAGDPGHPSEKVLKLLSDRSSQIEWARTDRNGLVSLRLDSEDPRFEIARGELSDAGVDKIKPRSEEHTSELQSLMRISYAVFC